MFSRELRDSSRIPPSKKTPKSLRRVRKEAVRKESSHPLKKRTPYAQKEMELTLKRKLMNFSEALTELLFSGKGQADKPGLTNFK